MGDVGNPESCPGVAGFRAALLNVKSGARIRLDPSIAAANLGAASSASVPTSPPLGGARYPTHPRDGEIAGNLASLLHLLGSRLTEVGTTFETEMKAVPAVAGGGHERVSYRWIDAETLGGGDGEEATGGDAGDNPSSHTTEAIDAVTDGTLLLQKMFIVMQSAAAEGQHGSGSVQPAPDLMSETLETVTRVMSLAESLRDVMCQAGTFDSLHPADIASIVSNAATIYAAVRGCHDLIESQIFAQDEARRSQTAHTPHIPGGGVPPQPPPSPSKSTLSDTLSSLSEVRDAYGEVVDALDAFLAAAPVVQSSSAAAPEAGGVDATGLRRSGRKTKQTVFHAWPDEHNTSMAISKATQEKWRKANPEKTAARNAQFKAEVDSGTRHRQPKQPTVAWREEREEREKVERRWQERSHHDRLGREVLARRRIPVAPPSPGHGHEVMRVLAVRSDR